MILALDIATVTGWAAGSPLSTRPSAGTIKTRGSLGQKASSLERALRDLGDQFNPDLIIFEQPIHAVLRKGNSNVMRLSMALCGIVEKVAYETSTKVVEVPISKWRKHFIGYARAPKGQPSSWCKQQVQRRCKAMGWGELPHDAAEACGILDYALSLRSRTHQMHTAPGLFDGAA